MALIQNEAVTPHICEYQTMNGWVMLISFPVRAYASVKICPSRLAVIAI